MTLPIDIFKIDNEGPRWLQAAASLEDAKAHIHQMAGALSGEYLLMNQLTGNKVVVKVNAELDGKIIAAVQSAIIGKSGASGSASTVAET